MQDGTFKMKGRIQVIEIITPQFEWNHNTAEEFNVFKSRNI